MTSGTAEAPPRPPLRLDVQQRELVLEEVAAVARTLRDKENRRRYGELARAVARGEVEGGLIEPLEAVLEITLGSGRARRLHGAEHERELRRLYEQTPGGAAVRETVASANRALGALAGQRIAAMRFTPDGPGTFRLAVDTDRCQVTLGVGRFGVTVESLGVEA